MFPEKKQESGGKKWQKVVGQTHPSCVETKKCKEEKQGCSKMGLKLCRGKQKSRPNLHTHFRDGSRTRWKKRKLRGRRMCNFVLWRSQEEQQHEQLLTAPNPGGVHHGGFLLGMELLFRCQAAPPQPTPFPLHQGGAEWWCLIFQVLLWCYSGKTPFSSQPRKIPKVNENVGFCKFFFVVEMHYWVYFFW